MDEQRNENLRISDTERERAIAALGEHMSAGRLSIDEYGDRTALVSTAKTRVELLAQFADLPEPKPSYDAPPPRRAAQPAPAAPPPQPEALELQPASAVERWQSRPAAQRLAGAAVPLVGMIALALFFITGQFWVFFLIPGMLACCGKAVFGHGWEHDRREYHHATSRERHQLYRA
ncbi:MAG: DUF1707 SHOCT-like domain-containing protein, partial [Sciscionella sp.]